MDRSKEMFSDMEECGYDATFVEEVPEYLKCIVCHLVLKNPIQIMICGHRYCASCYERIKSYSKHFNSTLCCPIDREVIDPTQVFKDTGISRVILDLKVRCTFDNNGCSWIGELRDCEAHGVKCQYGLTEICNTGKKENEEYPASKLLHQLSERLDKCEQGLLEKEKDLAHVKLHLHEVKEKVKEKETLINSLQMENLQIKDEMKSVRETNLELIEFVYKEVNEMKNNILSTDKQESDEQSKEMASMQKSQVSHNPELNELREEIIPVIDEIKQWKDHVNMSLYKMMFEWGRTSDEIDGLRAHINNTENLVSFKENVSLGDTVFVWRIHNFLSHADKGENMISSRFYSHGDGNLCGLTVEWSKEGNLGLFFRLLQNKSQSSSVGVFDKIIRFQILSRDGKKEIDQVVKSFSEGKKSAGTSGYGKSKLLRKDEFANYVSNNTLTIICTLVGQALVPTTGKE